MSARCSTAAFVVRNGAGIGTILAAIGVLAIAASIIVLIVRSTTKANRTKKDIWVATAGFTVTEGAANLCPAYGNRAGVLPCSSLGRCRNDCRASPEKEKREALALILRLSWNSSLYSRRSASFLVKPRVRKRR